MLLRSVLCFSSLAFPRINRIYLHRDESKTSPKKKNLRLIRERGIAYVNSHLIYLGSQADEAEREFSQGTSPDSRISLPQMRRRNYLRCISCDVIQRTSSYGRSVCSCSVVAAPCYRSPCSKSKCHRLDSTLLPGVSTPSPASLVLLLSRLFSGSPVLSWNRRLATKREMGKTEYKRLKGEQQFRLRLVLATLSGTPILIEDVRLDDTSPGLRPHEVSLLRLIETISDDCSVEISETGTKLRYKPGVVMGGKHFVHDCSLSRSIGYFLEPLILLALFGKKPLSIRLKGITNDPKDPSVDTFRTTTLHMLKHFGVPLEGLELKIEKRGASPAGGGEVVLGVPIVQNSLSATNWVDEGMVKRIRGVAFSTKVSPQFGNRIVYAARGVFNHFIPDVHIFIDHKSGLSGGKSPGYGVSLVAETTSGCLISADTAVCYTREDIDRFEDSEEKPELLPPEDLGVQAASLLLEEIERGGVVDSTHQGLLFTLCALCPQDVSKVRVGKLTPYAIETLRCIRDLLGVKFVIHPDPTSNTVVLKCVGCGLKNLSRVTS